MLNNARAGLHFLSIIYIYTCLRRPGDSLSVCIRAGSVSRDRMHFYAIISIFTLGVYHCTASGNESFSVQGMELNCRRLSCKLGERCVYRKNWCRAPPCPAMVFCSAEKNARTPASCDYVKCSRGYRCSTRYARDQRTGLYTNIYAYCVTEHEFKRRAVSCGGFECPRKEFACMLREPKCRVYPCRILQACIPRKDVERLIGTCNFANCSSFDHCYLKRSTAGCTDDHCSRDYRPACLHMRGEQPLPEICRGIICADVQVPVAKMRNCICQPCNDPATCAKIKKANSLGTYSDSNISREIIV